MKTEIDLTHTFLSPGLIARKIWQVLFDYYRDNDGSLTEMDNMLCDLLALTKAIEERKTEIWWGMTPGNTGFTNFTLFLAPNSNIKITIDLEEKKVLFHYFELLQWSKI